MYIYIYIYIYIYMYIYIYIYIYICIAHCSQFEHCRDSTIQSFTMCNHTSCAQVHAGSCHKAIMVITGRAHCYMFCIFCSHAHVV